MCNKMLGMDIVGVANAIRRFAFNESAQAEGDASPTHVQHWFLSYIWTHQDLNVSQRDLEAKFQIRRSTATEILKAMERKNFIIRETSADDKRVKNIHLTKLGASICEASQKKIDEVERKISQNITKEEIKMFYKVLDKIKVNIESI